MNKGQILILSGCAGSGKGTVLSFFREKCDRIFYSVSCTTRFSRPGEQNDVHFHFITREAFQNMIARDEFVEYTEYCGNFYGTPRKPLLHAVENGKIAILEIETEGAIHIMDQFPDHLSVFIVPPDGLTLENRLRKRGTESEEVIAKRMETARNEILIASRYQHILINHEGKAMQVADAILSLCNGVPVNDPDVVVKDKNKFIKHYFNHTIKSKEVKNDDLSLR